MRPERCARIAGSTAQRALLTPSTLTSMSLRASASGVNSIAPEMPMPAQLTSRSIRPSRASTSSTAARTACASETSQQRCSPSAGRRLSAYTVTPRARSARAVSSPMPLLPPVTIAMVGFIGHPSRR